MDCFVATLLAMTIEGLLDSPRSNLICPSCQSVAIDLNPKSTATSRAIPPR